MRGTMKIGFARDLGIVRYCLRGVGNWLANRIGRLMKFIFPTPFGHRLIPRMLFVAPVIAIAGNADAGMQTPEVRAIMLNETMPPGNNYSTAEFNFWSPPAPGILRGVVILMPGSNSDGRAMVNEPLWQSFAKKHGFALVGAYFTDRQHDQAFIENYVNASQGSGQALLDALKKFARRSHHPELATAPLLLWGVSAGGEFNYEFTAWKPERVLAFVVNKGGIYYTALTPSAARAVPALIFAGKKDLPSRTATLAGLFALNRRAGALWALVEEPDAGHTFEQSQILSLLFFDEVLSLRLGDQATTIKPVTEAAGYRSDLRSGNFVAADNQPGVDATTAWLPTKKVAEAWQKIVRGVPLE